MAWRHKQVGIYPNVCKSSNSVENAFSSALRTVTQTRANQIKSNSCRVHILQDILYTTDSVLFYPNIPLNKMNPWYFPLAATALKPQQIPLFLHISARIWGRRWYHKYQNSRILWKNRNYYSMKMPVWPRLHIHSKHARKFYPNGSV